MRRKVCLCSELDALEGIYHLGSSSFLVAQKVAIAKEEEQTDDELFVFELKIIFYPSLKKGRACEKKLYSCLMICRKLYQRIFVGLL